MKTVRRSNDTIFARNPGTKWHYATNHKGAIQGMCKFRGGPKVETSDDREKPASEVCKNCRKYAFYFGWNSKQ
jgi:hypothetical protein